MPFLEKKPDGFTSLMKKVAGELLLICKVGVNGTTVSCK